MNVTVACELTSVAAIVPDGKDNKMITVRFNGSFFDETIYRREASPQVDAAWEALGVNCLAPP